MADSKDNVKVAIRVRPLNAKESSETGRRCLTIHESSTISIDARPDPKVFTYDYVADENVTQDQIFEIIGKPIACSCLAGYNGTIFAYGQTGAGKTFTIQGLGIDELSMSLEKHHLRGVLPRCFDYIFNEITREIQMNNSDFLIKCSYLEIYQEQIHDLLDTSMQNLQIREDIKRGIYVDGLIEETVNNAFETYELLRIGAQNRHVGSTSMNKESSRSHSVFTMLIESKHNNNGLMNFRSSRFHLIDLAGSERQKATDAAGERLKEAGKINKSLSALGNVINSLVDISEGKSRHVHYRDSKLTFLLKDSLGGNSKTFIIANVSPASSAFSETLSTLKFAQRAKQIKNMAVVNEDTTGTVFLLKEEIKRLKEALANVKPMECPRCSGKIVERLDPIEANDVKFELEELLEKKIKINQETENYLKTQILEKDQHIQNLNVLIAKYEKKMTNDKMVIKFRDATIARLAGQNPPNEDTEVNNLKKEIEILKEQIESNPSAARLFVENERLKLENQELRRELKRDPSSSAARIEELEQFTQQLSITLKNSAEDRETIKNLFFETKEPRSSTLIDERIDYEEKILDLNKQLEDQGKQYSDYIEKIEALNNKLTAEIDFLKNKEFISEETQSEDLGIEVSIKEASTEHDSLRIKISEMENEIAELEKIKQELKNDEERLRKQIELEEEKIAEIDKLENDKKELENKLEVLREEIEKSIETHNAISKIAILEEELAFEKTKIEEKEAELKRANEEIENLSESSEYLKSNISDLQLSLSEKSQQIEDLNISLSDKLLEIAEYQGFISEKKQQIIELQNSLEEKFEKITDLISMVEEKSQIIENLQSSLEEKNRLFMDLQNIFDEKSHELSDLQNLFTERSNQLDDFKNSYIEQSQKIEDLQNLLTEKDNEANENGKINIKNAQIIENLESQILEKSQMIENLENSLILKNEEILNLKLLSDCKSQKFIEQENRVLSLENVISEKSKLVLDLEFSLKLKSEEISALKASLDETVLSLELKTKEISIIKKSLDENTLLLEIKSKEISTLKASLDENTLSFELKSKEISALKASLDESVLDITNAQNEILVLENKNNELNQIIFSIKDPSGPYATAIEENKALNNQISIMLQEKENNLKINDELKKEIESNIKLNDDLKKEIENSFKINDNLEKEIENLQSSHSELIDFEENSKNTINELQNRIANLTKEIFSYQEKEASLIEKIKSYKDQYQSLLQEYEKQEKNNNNLIDELNEKDQNEEALNERYIELKAEHQKVLLENEALTNTKIELLKENEDLKTKAKAGNEILGKTLEEHKIQIEKLKEEKEKRSNELTNEIKHLESELFKEAENHDNLETKVKKLSQDLEDSQKNAEHYQELSILVSQKNAEITLELAKLREIPQDDINELKSELELLKEENSKLKEENETKMEILKTTNKNILATRNEINMWKKCIDEKNNTIQDLRDKLRKNEEAIFQLNSEIKKNEIPNAQNEESEIKYLKQIVQLREKELKELKEKGQEYYSQADEALESQRREIEIITKRFSSAQGEVKRLKEELKISLQDRETMLEEIKRLRSEEYRSVKENEEIKKMLSQIREEKARILKDMEVLNKENDRLSGYDNMSQKVKIHEKLKEENSLLKTLNAKISDDLDTKTQENELLQKRFLELAKRKDIDEDLGKRLKRKDEEIQNLSEGLARITDYVFSLPIVNANPEETNIIDSTIKAISWLYEKHQEHNHKEDREHFIRGTYRSHTDGAERNTSEGSSSHKTSVAQYHSLLHASIRSGEHSAASLEHRHRHSHK
ncbi:unnamed protein product [Blepharisma stoltei]|uniref:Kinesin motor domain-containing protein n=1 Tax=Blepharisma stoltei TaxID=1481888 RepID=A0AAU9KJV4_9CILI|nr:unnamed protein product [Blepharisma stoltei]